MTADIEERVLKLESELSQINLNIGIITTNIQNMNKALEDIKKDLINSMKQLNEHNIALAQIKERYEIEDSIKQIQFKKFAVYLTAVYTVILTAITLIIRILFKV
ncbi:MAG: hypothetical protein QW745_08805 [Thermoplasmata archaeon]